MRASTIRFASAEPSPTSDHDAQTLLALYTEYLSFVDQGLLAHFGIGLQEQSGQTPLAMASASLSSAQAGGKTPIRLAVVEGDDQLLGMAGWRELRPGVGELKRFYVRPQARGQGLADQLLDFLITDMRQAGIRTVCLDSAPFMLSAHAFYQRHGFTDCAVYPGSEAPPRWHATWRFMEKSLVDTAQG